MHQFENPCNTWFHIGLISCLQLISMTKISNCHGKSFLPHWLLQLSSNPLIQGKLFWLFSLSFSWFKVNLKLSHIVPQLHFRRLFKDVLGLSVIFFISTLGDIQINQIISIILRLCLICRKVHTVFWMKAKCSKSLDLCKAKKKVPLMMLKLIYCICLF